MDGTVLQGFIIPNVSTTVEFIIIFAIAAAASSLILVFIFRRVRRYGDYAYTNARIHAMKRDLFRKEKLEPLVKAPDMQSLLNLMKDSHYSPYLEKIEKVSPKNIEIRLNNHLYDSYRKILTLAPEGLKEIFKQMGRILEVKNIKTILISKFAGVPPEEIEEKLFPRKYLSDEVYDRAIEAESFREAAAAFEETEYWEIIDEALTEFEETGSLYPIWFGLEQRYWKNVWRFARSSSARYSKIVRKAISMKIDVLNILTVLRCKMDGVDPQDIERFTVDAMTEVKSQDLKRAMEAEDIQTAIRNLEGTPYGDALSEAMVGREEIKSIFFLEKTLERVLVRKLRTLAIQYNSNAGPIAAFPYEKETEVKNLIRVVNGVNEGLDPDDIREKFIEPELK